MEKNLTEYGDILRPEDVQKILHVGRNTAQHGVQVPGGRHDQIDPHW